MKIIGYLGQQRYPKDKSIYDKNGNINENYIFAFDPTNALGNKKIFHQSKSTAQIWH